MQSNVWMGFVAHVLMAGACATTGAGHASSGNDAVLGRVHALMTAYAENDQPAVLALVDPRGFAMYGSDASEIVHDAAGLRQMMTDDFALWGTVALGPIQDLEVRRGGALATAFFQVPFSVRGGPPVLVRVATVWRNSDGRWVLTQSANTVPTVGSSARDLLQKAAH